MAEFVPVPFPVLLRRARIEFDRRHAIFDLPARKFYRGAGAMASPHAGLDLSVAYAGARAANPIGPAAGPHTQLAQNLALCWLAGSRILELKTVQINDALTLSRPCIDMATVGYNTEWSQELRLADSLREYVKASMLIECLEAWDVLQRGPGASGFVFDVSVGYDLAGLRSPAMGRWLESIRHADADGRRASRGDTTTSSLRFAACRSARAFRARSRSRRSTAPPRRRSSGSASS